MDTKISLANNLRIHDGLQFIVQVPAMPPLQIIVIRFVILGFTRPRVIFRPGVPLRVLPRVLVDYVAGIGVVFVARFYLILSQLQKGIQGGLTLVRQIVRNAPIHALREKVLGCQSAHSEAKGDL